jgi:hypothetical protein
VALVLGAVDHTATHMALVDLVADEAGHGTGGGRGLLAVATTDLVAEQATDHSADHGAADVAITFRQALLHRHVLADLVRVWVVEVSRTASVPITVA